MARLLVCHEGEPTSEPAGRLLRIVPIPIDRTETWITVKFKFDTDHNLLVRASGPVAQAETPDEVIPNLSLAYSLPPAPLLTVTH